MCSGQLRSRATQFREHNLSAQPIKFAVSPPDPRIATLRDEVRAFLQQARQEGLLRDSSHGWAVPDPAFSQELGRRGWIGMTWPKRYGGHERTALERHVVTEELLAAGAPVRAHWVADRQSGPLLLRFGTEHQRHTFLPEMAAGRLYFCIGMSEADSGSDLASIRTKAEKIDGGWLVNGAKIWTSNAHRVHMMILFARTGPRGESRREGVSQFLVDLKTPGITIRPILNLAGEHDFNEVVFADVFVPDAMVIGTIGNGWQQVNSELTYERSGPDRWMSSFHLLRAYLDEADADSDVAAPVGRLVSKLWTLHHMSMSVARMMEQGITPSVEAALVKDRGTQFEREIPEVLRLLTTEAGRAEGALPSLFNDSLEYSLLHAPSYTIRGGTKEILRGIIAKSLGLR
ncbi:acyl-CoA dehydrogenase family protein [Cupriavidus sp. L7L]|uniref:acyl-CoA dehydrogenase family protein n=1 Tax=Cupriavidus sp. L7L TaxID=2546443 RepID=UPI00140502AB|nr:acyl-CoA dehydrogenase family protein [Cupriavidus sp. L7L]